MDKISSNNNSKYPAIDKLGLQQCTFYFRRHILSYITNIKNIKQNLLFFSIDGKTGSELVRSFSWKIYLKTLSSDSDTTLRTWLDETVKAREEFKKIINNLMRVTKYKGDPLGGYKGDKVTAFFENADIQHLIKIDVDRTFQDRDLFCHNTIKSIENNILYLFSKFNEPIYYKQGMNDILAMFIYALYPYYTKSSHDKYTNELFDQWVEKPLQYAEDIYMFFHDERYFQTDMYYLFKNLMNLGVNKFYEDIDEKKEPGETKNYLVKRCEHISEKKLKWQNSRLYHHFINIGIEPGVVLQRWIKCLFTREFHPQDSAVIWDAILANETMEPSGDLSYIDYFSLAMLDFISDELLVKDQNECFKRLFSYPPIESMTTLINLTTKIKPLVLEAEKKEKQKLKELKDKELKNRQILDEILKKNRKLKKEKEENIEKKHQIEDNNTNKNSINNNNGINNNNSINNNKINNNNMNNMNLFNNLLFANQLNLMQNPFLFNNNNIKYFSPQLNNIQGQNQQVFPKMNIMFNNSTNMLININNINNNKKQVKNDDNKKSALDLLKNTYSESIEDKNKLLNELKDIFNKYKKNFNYDDSMRIEFLLDKLQKKI